MAAEHCKTVSEYGSEESDDEALQKEYEDMIRESDGFDIDGEKFKDLEGYGLIGALRGIPESYMGTLIRLSSYALKKHNEQQGTQLELVRVIKTNVQAVAGFRYFITLEAKDLMQDELKVYQLRVVEGIDDDDITVEILRLKPSSSPSPSSQVSPPP